MPVVGVNQGLRELELATLAHQETRSPEVAAPLLAASLRSWLEVVDRGGDLDEVSARLRRLENAVGTMVLPEDFSAGLEAARELLPDVRAVAARHELRVAAAAAPARANLKNVKWVSLVILIVLAAVIGGRTLTPDAPTARGSYFIGRDFNKLLFERDDGAVIFRWGAGRPHWSMPEDYFSVRWNATIDVPEDQTYTFFLRSDDGSRLFVNGEQVIDMWHPQGSSESRAKVPLEKGTAELVVEFFEEEGDAEVLLAWSSPTRPKRPILWHEGPPRAFNMVAKDGYARKLDPPPPVPVERYAPAQAYNGFTLTLHDSRRPRLIDMNGQVVHSWPTDMALGRARLTPTGDLWAIVTDNSVRRYSWQGDILQIIDPPHADYWPHHDFTLLESGNILVPYMDPSGKDHIYEMTPGGEVVWTWLPTELFRERFGARISDPSDFLHINSLDELPPNPLFERGDQRFAPGNILVSARNISTIFIIDKKTRLVVWEFNEGLEYQHEARMIRAGTRGAGMITVFNNGFNRPSVTRRSQILGIHPAKNKALWTYNDEHFFSGTGGITKLLPNGNIFIATTDGGRIFEVGREGEVVWQVVPPGFPMRPERYAYDYCHPCAKLDRSEAPVAPGPDPFIDRQLFEFTTGTDHRADQIKVRRQQHAVLPAPRSCAELIIPRDASLYLRYGLAEDRPEIVGTFEVTIERRADGDKRVIHSDTVRGVDDEIWREPEAISLADYAYDRINLCLAASASSASSEVKQEWVRWAEPMIEPPEPTAKRRFDLNALPPAERLIVEQQLKAIGYMQ